jgi:hypothetical protein
MRKMKTSSLDRKPGQRAEQSRRVPSTARARKRLIAMQTGFEQAQTGGFLMSDRAPSGKKIGVVVGAVAGKHILGVSPSVAFAYDLRRRLAATRYPRPDVKVFGPDGETLVATINPDTRKRTQIGERPGDQK